MNTTTLQDGTYSALVEYIHQLKEDTENGILRAGISLRVTSTPDKLEYYTTFSGTGFVTITPDKVRILQRTTTTTIETMLLDEHP